MQCKDIPDAPIIDFLLRLERGEILHDYGTGSFYPSDGTIHNGFPHSVCNAMPDRENTPPKLVLAKMNSMLRRKLVDGCGCGCRGDWTVAGALRSEG